MDKNSVTIHLPEIKEENIKWKKWTLADTAFSFRYGDTTVYVAQVIGSKEWTPGILFRVGNFILHEIMPVTPIENFEESKARAIEHYKWCREKMLKTI